MSVPARLQFALTHVQSSHWSVFEQLASAFAAVDFPALRVLAGVGDEGRDAVLQDAAADSVIIQYSIAEDWKRKIRDTVKRLDEAGHKCTVLIYFTNRQIGVAGDRLKAEMLRAGISLDIRDRSYFIARVHNSRGQQLAAEQFANEVVDPLLPVEDVLRQSPITNPHLRAGLLYLELQAHDLESGRNIVRLSYDALVLAALQDTDQQTRLTRDRILDAVTSALPGRDKVELGVGVDGALMRLRNKKQINFTGKDRTYNLQFEQRKHRDEQAIDLLAERETVRGQLVDLARSVSHELEVPLDELKLDPFAEALESLFEVVLERQGNQFAEAIRVQVGSSLRQDIHAVAADFVSARSLAVSFGIGRDALVDLLVEAMAAALLLGGPVRRQLRRLADAYTLLAFMRETNDVQEAVGRFFSKGVLIFDTTAVLPCFGETLLPDDDRSYTNLIKNAQAVGMELFVTPDVCNEIYSHFKRAITCARVADAWEGPIPLVYADWLQKGGTGSFASFADMYAGKGEDEVQFFLETALGFRIMELEEEAAKVSDTTRFAVQELWRPRKRLSQGSSEMERDILLRHDLHMYFGVLGLRRGEKRDYYGYEAWWVTEDGTAVRMHRYANGKGIDLPSDPCMNPTFLSAMLAIGPSGHGAASSPHGQLPLALAMQRFGYGVENLTSLANEIRAELAHEPEWVIRRKIWERMNELKQGGGLAVGDELFGVGSDELLIESADEQASTA
jgi:hypothetical protein